MLHLHVNSLREMQVKLPHNNMHNSHTKVATNSQKFNNRPVINLAIFFYINYAQDSCFKLLQAYPTQHQRSHFSHTE